MRVAIRASGVSARPLLRAKRDGAMLAPPRLDDSTRPAQCGRGDSAGGSLLMSAAMCGALSGWGAKCA